MNSSYGEEDSVKDKSKQDEIMDHADSENQQSQHDEAIGHFDEFGQFKYNTPKKQTERAQLMHYDLKDLSEQNFLDLIGAKNQDKRFYSWLHFHPLFDDEDWDSDDGFGKSKKQKPRRGSEQVNLDSRLDCEP